MEFLPVHKWEARRRFNCGGFEARIRSGDLTIHQDRPGKPRYGTWLPDGSRSQMIWYMDSGNTPVAKLHRYIDPLGKVLASKRPDPKSVVVKGTKFVVFADTRELPISMHVWASINAL